MNSSHPMNDTEFWPDHRSKVAAAFDNAKAKGRLPARASFDEIEWDLQIACWAYLTNRDGQKEKTPAKRDLWRRIVAQLEELAVTIDAAEDPDNPALIDDEERARAALRSMDVDEQPPTLSYIEVRIQESANLRKKLKRWSEISTNMATRAASFSEKRKGDRDPDREILYGALLQQWTRAGGELVVPSATKTGGPLAMFLTAVLAPILGEDTPKVSTIRKIVERERDRRAAGAFRGFETLLTGTPLPTTNSE